MSVEINNFKPQNLLCELIHYKVCRKVQFHSLMFSPLLYATAAINDTLVKNMAYFVTKIGINSWIIKLGYDER